MQWGFRKSVHKNDKLVESTSKYLNNPYNLTEEVEHSPNQALSKCSTYEDCSSESRSTYRKTGCFNWLIGFSIEIIVFLSFFLIFRL